MLCLMLQETDDSRFTMHQLTTQTQEPFFVIVHGSRRSTEEHLDGFFEKGVRWSLSFHSPFFFNLSTTVSDEVDRRKKHSDQGLKPLLIASWIKASNRATLESRGGR